MEIFWTVLAGLMMVAGILGCFLPFIPGPPLSFAALLLLQLREVPPFSSRFLIFWAVITVAATVLDYFIPVWGTRRFGGSSYGVWGCTIGLLVGFFFGPAGIIICPFIGAFAGEMINSKNSSQALRSAIGSFLGFLAGTLLKAVVCVVMLWHFVTALI
jgi:uncharacterized protein YqgC (DUF456 family)